MRPTSLIATGTVRQRDLVRDAADCRPQGDGAVPVVDHGQVLAGTGEEIHDRLAGRRVGRSGKGVGSRRLTIAVHYLSRTPTPRGVTCSSPESLTAGDAPVPGERPCAAITWDVQEGGIQLLSDERREVVLARRLGGGIW